MIYTSYFAHYKGDNGVAICLGAPWWKGERYPNLAPYKELLDWWKNVEHSQQNIAIYVDCYRQYVLSTLDVHTVASELEGKVLLCFEKPNDFCHRQVVAQWLRENGYKCEELK